MRPREPVGVMHVVVAVAALDAEGHAVDRRIGRAGDAHNLAVAHVEVEVAADAAVGAGRAHLADLAETRQPQAHLVVERADRAVGHALAAALAARVEQRLVGAGHELALEAALGEVPHVAVLDLGAGAHAAAAQDALVAVDEDEWIGVGIDGVGVARAARAPARARRTRRRGPAARSRR